jgi:hypothetical protein
LCQEGGDLGQLRSREQGRGTRRGAMAQGIDARGLGPPDPAADGTLGAAEGRGNRLLGLAQLVQFPRPTAPAFFPIHGGRGGIGGVAHSLILP